MKIPKGVIRNRNRRTDNTMAKRQRRNRLLVTDIKCKKGLQITKRGNQKITKGELETVIVEGQTTQWPKEKVERDKQRSTKYYTENKRSSNTNLTKTGDKLRCSGRVSSSCSTCGTRRCFRWMSWIGSGPICLTAAMHIIVSGSHRCSILTANKHRKGDGPS